VTVPSGNTGSLRRLPGRKAERFRMGSAVVVGQDLTEAAGPIRHGTVANLATGDRKLGNGHRETVGARKPSTSIVCSRVAASFASSTVGLSSSVDASINGVKFVIIPEITGCDVSNIS
jgi:hypothetical protein